MKVKKKSKTAGPKLEYQKRIIALRDFLNKKQKDFAEQLGVSRTAVSKWEGGSKRDEPSPETYVRIGNVAPYPAAKWFWQQAGLDLERMRDVIHQEFGQAAAPLRGEVLSIPRVRTGAAGFEQTGDHLAFASEWLVEPAAARFIIVDAGAGIRGSGVRLGECIVFDTSSNAERLCSLKEQDVMIRFWPREKGTEFDRYWRPGLLIGKLRCEEQEGYPMNWWRATVDNETVAHWRYKVPEALCDAEGKFISDDAQKKSWLEADALFESGSPPLRLYKGCELVGRVVARIVAPRRVEL